MKMKKNKLYILTLIPLALAMTSFNIETQTDRRSIELGSLAEVQEFAPTTSLPENTDPPQGQTVKVDPSDIIEHVEDISRQMNLTIDLNNDSNEETRLEITGIESKQVSSTSISPGAREEEQDKIVLTIRSHTDSNLEAVSGVDCECDTRQLIRIELTPSDLGLTADTDLESLDKNKLREALQAKAPVIIEKINQQRLSQHEERLAEKDCSLKENDREQLDCLIDRVKESSGEEKEEFVAEIEDQMRNLLYSEESSDQRTFDTIFRKLKGDRALTDLKARLDEHKDIKDEIDDYKETSTPLANDVRDFNLMYEDSLDMITNIERNGFKYPQDWQNYQTALRNMDSANNMILGAQFELNTMTRSFRSDFDRIAQGSGLGTQDIQIARNYAFPTTVSRGRRSVRGRMAVSQMPLGLGTDPLNTSVLGDRSYRSSLGMTSRFGHPSRVPISSNLATLNGGRGRSGMRGGGGRADLFRYDSHRTLSRPQSLHIDRHQPSRGRGRSIMMSRGRGTSI